MIRSRLLLSLIIVAVVAGCASANKAERSAEITASGDASLENWVTKGLTTTRIFTVRVDGELLQTAGRKGVFPLQPGAHVLSVVSQFSRMAVGDLIIDAGGADLSFEAKPGTRYRLRGDKLSHTSAELWIEDVATGRPVTPKTPVELSANPQNIPVVIPIPVSS